MRTIIFVTLLVVVVCIAWFFMKWINKTEYPDIEDIDTRQVSKRKLNLLKKIMEAKK